MKRFGAIVMAVSCCFFALAADGNNPNPTKNEELKKQQLIYEKMLKAYQQDLAASEKMKAENREENTVRAVDSTENKTEQKKDGKAVKKEENE